MPALSERFDVRVTVLYAAIASLWIVITDGLLITLSSQSSPPIPAVGLLKGLGFVAVTSLALYSILSAELRRRMRVEQALQQDITERKGLQAVQEQHVRAMEDLRQFLQATLDAFPANTVVLDVDGTIISFNAAWAHFAGRNGARTATHFLETNYLTVCDTAVGPGSAEAAAAAAGIRGVIAGFHDHFVLEYPCDSPDKQRWFAMRVTPLEKPAPRRVVIAHLDLTERWLAQEELQKALGTSEQRIIERTSELQAAKERVEAIVNNSADGILLVNFDLCIHQTNLSFSRLFGCAPGDFSGASFETLTHPDDADLVVETVGAAVAERNRKTTEVRARRRDGSLFDAELSVGFVSGEGLVCNVRDITERKRSEEALRQALVAEKELSELKSRFVSMASHEFRTPLATILTNADILAAYRDKMSEDQVTEKLKTIQEQVALLRDIMEDLLHMARMEARRVEFKPVFLDPDALCREVIEEFQSGRGATHRLVYSCGPVPQSVSLDKKLMRQIVSNLVSNAVKYSEAGTTVTVRLEQDGDSLTLQVRDKGLGIPQVDLKHLFMPFHRATNVGTISGIGLGLVIVKESVNWHGGTIAVESQIGVGTTFTVRVPIASHYGAGAAGTSDG